MHALQQQCGMSAQAASALLGSVCKRWLYRYRHVLACTSLHASLDSVSPCVHANDGNTTLVTAQAHLYHTRRSSVAAWDGYVEAMAATLLKHAHACTTGTVAVTCKQGLDQMALTVPSALPAFTKLVPCQPGRGMLHVTL